MSSFVFSIGSASPARRVDFSLGNTQKSVDF